MNTTTFLRTAILSFAVSAMAQAQPFVASLPAEPVDRAIVAEPGDQNDPAHNLYRAGYNLILDERWKEARTKLEELLKKYPKSNYNDDARYWSAYALMHTDLKKARAAYQDLINKHPQSSYLDDAVADLSNIEMKLQQQKIRTGMTRPLADSLDIPEGPDVIVGPDMPHFGSDLRRSMRELKWSLRGLGRTLPRMLGGMHEGKERDSIDPALNLRLQALAAIGNNKDDEKAFQTLKEVALDRTQPEAMRLEALDQLSGFTKQNVATVYLDVAKNDTAEDLQVAAIDLLQQSMKDRGKSVGYLASLYSELPEKRSEQRAMILYEIANVGNDTAVDFLAKIARSDRDYELRSDAVYYLGNIGGEKARAALYEILKGR